MGQSSFRSVLLAGAAAFGLCAMAQSASAVVVANSGDFQVIESCDASLGCSGTFTVVNNSAGDGDWYVFGFKVGNPNPFTAGTSQTDWTATTGCFTGSVCGSGDAFIYSNPATPIVSDLANDVGPGQTSSLFTFNSAFAASPVELNLANSDGGITTVSLEAQDVPEPASLAILGTGLLGLVRVSRRRRSNART